MFYFINIKIYIRDSFDLLIPIAAVLETHWTGQTYSPGTFFKQYFQNKFPK